MFLSESLKIAFFVAPGLLFVKDVRGYSDHVFGSQLPPSSHNKFLSMPMYEYCCFKVKVKKC